jgi:hypothetical protein
MGGMERGSIDHGVSASASWLSRRWMWESLVDAEVPVGYEVMGEGA